MFTLNLCDLSSLRLKGPTGPVYNGVVPKRMKFLAPWAVSKFVDLLIALPFIAFSDIFRDPIASLEARRSKAGVQRPGYSAHNYGFAFDVDVDQVLKAGAVIRGAFSYPTLLGILKDHGFTCHRPDGLRGSEDWHFNYLDGIDATQFPRSAGPQKLILDKWGSFLQGDEAWVQECLKEVGLYRGEIDGAFGPQSKASLMAFERAYDLTPDGIIDEMTSRTLAIATAKKDIWPVTDLITPVQMAELQRLRIV